MTESNLGIRLVLQATVRILLGHGSPELDGRNRNFLVCNHTEGGEDLIKNVNIFA
jgi:hypothetical protein